MKPVKYYTPLWSLVSLLLTFFTLSACATVERPVPRHYPDFLHLIPQHVFSPPVASVYLDLPEVQAEAVEPFKDPALVKGISKHYKAINKTQAKEVVRLVYLHSNEANIKPTLVLGLIGAESSFKNNARSKVGAAGYTQVLPKWHQDKIRGRNIYTPSTNIEVGVKVLKDCFKRRKTERAALACYNGASRKKDIDNYTADVYHHVKKIESMLL